MVAHVLAFAELFRTSLRSRDAAIWKMFVLAALLVAGVATTFWFGYRATREWERSVAQTLSARGKEVLALVAVAIDQDMKGAQLKLLMPLNRVALERNSLYDLADRCAASFARFPYIESVYIWKEGDHTYLFNRSERPPVWDIGEYGGGTYPVVIRKDPAALAGVVDRTRHDAVDGLPYGFSEVEIGGTPYQMVVHRIYADDGQLAALAGFTVNLDWLRQQYFVDLLRQVQRVTGDPAVRLQILDETGSAIADVGPRSADVATTERPFPVVFADRGLATSLHTTTSRTWTARVQTGADAALALDRRAHRRTLLMLGFGAATAIVGLLLTTRAIRASAALATRQSEFVSAVSHEMKTPLSLITLAGDSLAAGRCQSPESIREYGRLLSSESRQLTSLIDNVLCYAKLTDQVEPLAQEPVDVAELTVASIERFRMACVDSGCEIRLEAASQLPLVPGDRRMLQSVVDNIIDNAIKYGASGGVIDVMLDNRDQRVMLTVTDHGEGIASIELPHVFDKFHRGEEAARRSRGRGLGLTLAARIVSAHRGNIDIRSAEGTGTTVLIALPSY
jgi:signal transduction histidine kinase